RRLLRRRRARRGRGRRGARAGRRDRGTRRGRARRRGRADRRGGGRDGRARGSSRARRGRRADERARVRRVALPRPVAVAITGGIGAGKSEALKAFAEHGAAVVSSDEIVHQLLPTDEEVRAAVRDRWGAHVFKNTSDVDRAAIAEIVFRDRGELDWLEG